MKTHETPPLQPNEIPPAWGVADGQTTGDDPSAQVFDCWNTIGVRGNGTCRELLRFTHCRNCSVYAAAAAQLLDRPILPAWQLEWSEHFAREKQLTTPAWISVVIFRIGPEWLALPTPAFQEVAERRTLHTLPHRRQGVVLGLVNIRGELLICVSLGRLLGLSPEFRAGEKPGLRFREPSGREESAMLQTRGGLNARLSERLLVTIWDGKRLASPVDEVQGIRRVHQDELCDPPSPCSKLLKAAFQCPIAQPRPAAHEALANGGRAERGEHTVGLLDAENLFATLNRNLA